MRFPIVCFKDKDNMMYFFDKENTWLKTTEELLKENVFKGVKVVDSDGYFYKIKNVKKLGYYGFFGINPLLKGWWKDREIKIEYEYEPNVEKIELDVIKDIANEKVEKSKSFWESAWNIRDLKNAIKNAKTFEELIVLFR